jgi:hypothetical protein
VKLPPVALDRRDLAGLLRAIETSPNDHVKKTALRLAQENFPAAPQLVALSRPMGSPALARYEAARAATTTAARPAILAEFAAATDDWTRSALIAGAKENAADFIAAALTEIAGSSAVFDRGFVTYSNEAKHEMLGVSFDLIDTFGAVSVAVAAGALHS